MSQEVEHTWVMPGLLQPQGHETQRASFFSLPVQDRICLLHDPLAL